MKLLLIFHGRFPSEKAASLFAAKSAEAFADEGLDVTILAPRRFGCASADAFSFYSVRKNFKIAHLPTLDLFWVPFIKDTSIAFFASFLAFSLSCFVYIAFQKVSGRFGRDGVVYSNEWLPLLFATLLSSRTFYEMHDFPESRLTFFGWCIRKMKWVLIHNRWKAEKAAGRLHLPAERILCRMNAVDVTAFDSADSQAQARAKLATLADFADRKIVMYTGHLYGWKGVDMLAQATAEFTKDILTVFVGGTPKDVVDLKTRHIEAVRAGRMVVVGHRPHSEMPLWQKAADVLVLPNTAKEDISKYYTSPMKLFEYMASQRPIVASDIPSIREVVDDTSALLCEPDAPKALAGAITEVLGDAVLAARLSGAAFERVKKNTWQARAKEIIQFIK